MIRRTWHAVGPYVVGVAVIAAGLLTYGLAVTARR